MQVASEEASCAKVEVAKPNTTTCTIIMERRGVRERDVEDSEGWWMGKGSRPRKYISAKETGGRRIPNMRPSDTSWILIIIIISSFYYQLMVEIIYTCNGPDTDRSKGRGGEGRKGEGRS